MCKHSEETDGFNCYECSKGLQDNFEADKEKQFIEMRKLTIDECLKNELREYKGEKNDT